MMPVDSWQPFAAWQLMVGMLGDMQQRDGRSLIANYGPSCHTKGEFVSKHRERAGYYRFIAQGREQLHGLNFGLLGLFWLLDFFAALIFSLTHQALFS